MLDAREPKFNLSTKDLEQNFVRNKNYNKRVVEISSNEINMHKGFLKKELKKNYYWAFLKL